MAEERAREIGSRIQPRLSLAIGEGKWEENLRRLALASWFGEERGIGGEERYERREIQARKRKMERTKGRERGL
jgi:hypothetical protein